MVLSFSLDTVELHHLVSVISFNLSFILITSILISERFRDAAARSILEILASLDFTAPGFNFPTSDFNPV